MSLIISAPFFSLQNEGAGCGAFAQLTFSGSQWTKIKGITVFAFCFFLFIFTANFYTINNIGLVNREKKTTTF
jgi:hypothetical protein